MVRSLLHLIGVVVPLGLLLAGLSVLMRRLRSVSLSPMGPMDPDNVERSDVRPGDGDGDGDGGEEVGGREAG